MLNMKNKHGHGRSKLLFVLLLQRHLDCPQSSVLIYANQKEEAEETKPLLTLLVWTNYCKYCGFCGNWTLNKCTTCRKGLKRSEIHYKLSIMFRIKNWDAMLKTSTYCTSTQWPLEAVVSLCSLESVRLPVHRQLTVRYLNKALRTIRNNFNCQRKELIKNRRISCFHWKRLM